MVESSRAGLGVLTPSSNTHLEPAITLALAGASPRVIPHFGRFRVTAIDVAPDQLAQFDLEPMLSAADLLMDAQPSALVWAGTSGGWLGLERDRELSAALGQRSGVPATTTSLALVELLRAAQVTRVGFATPYVPEVCAAIRRTFSDAGLEVVDVRGLGVVDNLEIGRIPIDRIDRMVEEVAAAGCECVVVYCTNLDASPHAARLEQQFGVDVVDSIALSAWAGIRLIDNAAYLGGFGRLLGSRKQ